MRSRKKKVADVIISQVVLAGEICFKRGIRDTGSDTEQTHTQINLKSSIEDRCDLKKWVLVGQL